MFRAPQYLKKTEYFRFDLETPLTFPGNDQNQDKNGKRFAFKDRDNYFDWYNAYFRVNFKLEATADGANVAVNARSAPINGSFSLIKNLKVRSTGKDVYTANSIHKAIFIKNLLDFSDDYARSCAKNQFWYLDIELINYC